ncbi:MAG TPA: DUF1592 domain-containing protein [Sphingobium sp.]
MLAGILLGAAMASCSVDQKNGLADGPGAHRSSARIPMTDAAQLAIMGMRRLTEEQYRNIIADIFGADVKIGGRFDPIVRPVHELVATGASESTISPAGFEQYDQMARDIAAQVLGEGRRQAFLPCAPVDATKPDAACARAFLGKVGLLVYRRPLSASEIDFYVGLAARGTAPINDFYKGLELSLASMLVAPEFLYRMETAAPGGQELDGYAKASRLSFLIWNSGPDAMLFKAAETGALDTPEGARAQVDRMLSSPRVEQGARAFFSDFLQLDSVGNVSKDTLVYPRFTAGVGEDLKEQALRTIVDHMLTRNGSYPDLFTTRRTFLNRKLGLVYQVPVATPTGWQSYEFPANSDRLGLLGQGAFLALFSHEGRSSPTLRGRAIREVLLCQPVPDPPANVDFSGFNDTSNAVLKTARQRLTRHNTDPVCAACHKITDPLGLPLEKYDGIGSVRQNENGEAIDTSGMFEGKTLDGLAGLANLMAQSSSPSECMAKRALEYATGRTADDLSDEWMQAIYAAFQSNGYKYRELLRTIALSPQFFRPAAPALPEPGAIARLDASEMERH